MGILVCGLNGAGKSTVGRLLAERLGWRFIDNEDLYFPKDDPSYLYARPRSGEEVRRRLEAMIADERRFVFAAVRGDYGDALTAALDCAVCIDAPKEVRLRRVRERSFRKFGDRMLDGGDLAERENAFFRQVERRPEDYVEAWLRGIACPVLHVDGTRPAAETVEYIIRMLTETDELRQLL